MRLYTVRIEDKSAVAVEKAGRFYLINDLGLKCPDMMDLICSADEEELNCLRDFVPDRTGCCYADSKDLSGYGPDQVKLCAPIEYPRQDIVCVGVNYYSHIEETKHIEDMTRNEAAVYFSKRADKIIGPGDLIPHYPFVDKLDYEAELAVIIGRDIRDYRRGEGKDPVFGYSVFNDVSARNLQFKHKQWYRGKSLDGYSILGPCIVTADEIVDVQCLSITCTVNGELRQNSNTRLMIRSVHEVIEDFSAGITLRAGTIIATGTPGGVALGMQPPRYLESGDKVVCSIEQIGSLENTVA